MKTNSDKETFLAKNVSQDYISGFQTSTKAGLNNAEKYPKKYFSCLTLLPVNYWLENLCFRLVGVLGCIGAKAMWSNLPWLVGWVGSLLLLRRDSQTVLPNIGQIVDCPN